ncbi:hypothetical protein [Halorientalis sp.]|uniref:hypothetical protein n=1 Tax=Halorientalis sp. TaxID=1931229 RepID=UPI002619BA7E|nr:hypothetical protein [Halorientalis sp.]
MTLYEVTGSVKAIEESMALAGEKVVGDDIGGTDETRRLQVHSRPSDTTRAPFDLHRSHATHRGIRSSSSAPTGRVSEFGVCLIFLFWRELFYTVADAGVDVTY